MHDLEISLMTEGRHLGTVSIAAGPELYGGSGPAHRSYRYSVLLADGQAYQGELEHVEGDGFGLVAAVMAEIGHKQRDVLRSHGWVLASPH